MQNVSDNAGWLTLGSGSSFPSFPHLMAITSNKSSKCCRQATKGPRQQAAAKVTPVGNGNVSRLQTWGPKGRGKSDCVVCDQPMGDVQIEYLTNSAMLLRPIIAQVQGNQGKVGIEDLPQWCMPWACAGHGWCGCSAAQRQETHTQQGSTHAHHVRKQRLMSRRKPAATDKPVTHTPLHTCRG
jgi:hypothetical protein